jgi:hypothetical protein
VGPMTRDVLIDDGTELISLGFIAADVECNADRRSVCIYAPPALTRPEESSRFSRFIHLQTALSCGALPNQRARHVEQLDRYR